MDLEQNTNNLIVSAKLGNQEALNQLFLRYQSRILRIVRLRLDASARRRLDMQSMDVLQEVFIYALQHLKDFEPKSEGHFRNWLGVKIKHYILDRLDYVSRQKRKGLGENISMDQPQENNDQSTPSPIQIEDQIENSEYLGPTPSKCAVIKEEREFLDSVLEKLDPEEKELIIQRDLEELTFKEMGEMAGKSEDAARKSYCRAFKKLMDFSEPTINKIMTEQSYRDLNKA
jgi:RNA polymerase sigma-70 factor (subfamily 1)